MPGGQYTNLREQARSMGLETRWGEVAQAYADANQLLGDIVKVTPSSKVVGDLALFMVAGDYSAADIADPQQNLPLPDSLVAMMRGELGYPPEGFSARLAGAYLARPNAHRRPRRGAPAACGFASRAASAHSNC